MKKCLAIRHVAFEDLGTLEPVLIQQGYEIIYSQSGVDKVQTKDWLACDLAVVLGGPIGVNDAATYPYLTWEKQLVRERLQAGKPLLGICLGAQLMASALGASVYRGNREIGWATLDVAMGGTESPLHHLDGVPVLHWHGETFDLPAGARLLASTERTPNQAFAVGSGLALQFHAEADATRLETWLIGHACELGMAGLDPRVIRADAVRFGGAVRDAGQAMFRDWLASVAIA